MRYLWRPNLADEGDNFVLEIAVAAWPCTIVTHNLADFARAELRFPQIAICTPGQLGVSENRLYAELIHDGLLIREQMLYMTKLREIAVSTTKEDALAVLAKAPETPPLPTDVY